MILLAEKKKQDKNSAVKGYSVIYNAIEQNRKLFNGRESLISEPETWIDTSMQRFLYLENVALMLYWSKLNAHHVLLLAYLPGEGR